MMQKGQLASIGVTLGSKGGAAGGGGGSVDS